MKHRTQKRGLGVLAIVWLILCLIQAAPDPAHYVPLTYRQAEWYGSTFWTGPDWTRVGRDWHHPGTNTPSIRTFTFSQGGAVTITGRVFKKHLDGDGITAEIQHNDRKAWSATIEGKDSEGQSHKLQLTVKKGDVLRFVVDKRKSISCDTTGWDPVVEFTDGLSFRASTAFDKHAQGHEGWRYEMLAFEEAKQEIPVALLKEGGDLPPSMWKMILEDWLKQDGIPKTSFAEATKEQIGKAHDLLKDLRGQLPPGFAEECTKRLAKVGEGLSPEKQWVEIRKEKRRIALANPLLKFGPLLVCKRKPPSWSHLVAQYFGWRQRPGGGLYVIENPGYSLKTRDILQGQLPPGNILEPRLSYDGQRILFAYVACSDEVPDPASLPVNEEGGVDRYFHLYEIGVDGTGLRQLTDGRYDDMMAEYLPGGDIVFCSSRRKGYSRCFGPEYSKRWHTYTLHRMDAGGGNIRTISFNDVSEWFPTVSHSGDILFARWDYIDRDAVTHQNLWSARPDGTNPEAVWGNAAPKPHCTFQAKPIPGSHKLVFIASAHHAITAGPVCVLDPNVDANSLDAITRITPLPFPEAEGALDEWYASPWPLSEKYFLTGYSPYSLRFQGEHMHNPNPDDALGVYLLDAAGNRELLYRDPEIGTTNPIPLVARRKPPVFAETLPASAPDTGEMVLTDVHHGLDGIPKGVIKELRVVQLFPKTTWLANQPRIGLAGEENGRAILGTVPVESDGSAYFSVPARKQLLFQVLDADGFVRRTMRSSTYVQPGERVSCVGCHQTYRMSAPPPPQRTPLALKRQPSTPKAGSLDGRPFSFVEMVQPVLDQKCVSCHGGEKTEAEVDLTGKPHGGFTRSYLSLCKTEGGWRERYRKPELDANDLVPRFWQRNQIQVSAVDDIRYARQSRLMKLLMDGHYDVKLDAKEVRRIATWIDMNAIFYGVYDPEKQARQLAGKPVTMPDVQ